MSEFKAPWSWDDNVWEECDPMQRAPWLVDAAGNPVLKGEIRCASEELAHLIAAAPLLLEALRRCKFDSLNMSMEDLEFCRAAYAKAIGA